MQRHVVGFLSRLALSARLHVQHRRRACHATKHATCYEAAPRAEEGCPPGQLCGALLRQHPLPCPAGPCLSRRCPSRA